MKYLNCTAHPIELYEQKDLTSNRKEQYYLRDSKAAPRVIIPQNMPLSIHQHSFSLGEFEEVSLFSPVITVDPVLDTSYDVIIVSSRYAQVAMTTMPLYYDLLDRLYTVVPLFNKDPEKTEFPEKIGAAGIQKVWFSQNPVELYETILRRNCRPSLASIEVYLRLFEMNTQTSPNNMYTLQFSLQKLRQIRDDILKAEETAPNTGISQS